MDAMTLARQISPDVAPAPVSATEADWSRERCRWGYFEPGKYLVCTIRRYQRWKGRWGPVGRVLCAIFHIQNRFWGLLCGCEMPTCLRIGGGLLLPHPQGIIIHGQATLGPNCLLFQQVTIGTGGAKPGVPALGGHVDVGCGAKILGGVTIGDHARIGANAVVLCDVPPGATAVGIPARVIAPENSGCG
jgi:serine O-acetyltransferase